MSNHTRLYFIKMKFACRSAGLLFGRSDAKNYTEYPYRTTEAEQRAAAKKRKGKSNCGEGVNQVNLSRVYGIFR
jgi:hypothetical protein